MSDQPETKQALIPLTAAIVSAYITSHRLPAGQLTGLIGEVHLALSGLGNPVAVPEPESKPVPAVPIRKSVQDDYLICLEDGKKFKTLKRHLMVHYGMTAEDYRAKWGLPADYPMTAPAYAARRSELAVSAGLGQRRAAATKAAPAVEDEGEPTVQPRKRAGRPAKQSASS